VIIRNEENFADKLSFNLNNALMLILIFASITFVSGGSIWLERKVVRKLISKEDPELVNQKLLKTLSQRLDSVEIQLEQKNSFIRSLKRVMVSDYGDSVGISAIENAGATTGDGIELDYIAPIDSQLRSEFEDAGDQVYNFNASISYKNEFSSIVFFSPLSGAIVTSKFNLSKGHYGVDLAAPKDEPVKSITDGMVILSTWTHDAGYMIAIQHKSNLVSVYKHNSLLLKKVGSFVSAGDIIAIIGDSGEVSTGPHLHLELWHNGNPLNPTEFISL
jgi:murein DD-endopeptidase MepM/ murein hydrolase activator NlpD